MWGNLQGWCIAALLTTLLGWRTWQLTQLPPTTPPTRVFPKLLEPVRLEPGHEKVVPLGTDAGDAGPLYQQAADHYRRNEGKYRRFRERPKVETVAELEAIGLIMQGANKQSMTLLRNKPEELLNYDGSSETVSALRDLGGVIDTVGTLHRRITKNYGEAEKYFNAAFSLGRHLYTERVGYDELSAGSGMMGKSAMALQENAKDRGNPARAAEIQEWAARHSTYLREQVMPVAQFIRGVEVWDGKVNNLVAPHAGDVLLLARSGKDPMWRAEAILKLGRMKFNAAKRGDQVAAGREIPKFLNDPDPTVRAAAKAADKMTIDEYRMMRVIE
jgi:hypothetical protein